MQLIDTFHTERLIGAQYDASRTFSLFPRRHELGEVLRILKRLGQAVVE